MDLLENLINIEEERSGKDNIMVYRALEAKRQMELVAKSIMKDSPLYESPLYTESEERLRDTFLNERGQLKSPFRDVLYLK